MKNRFYKVLSIMMTLLMVFSVCSCLIGIVSAAETVTYYVKASGSDSAEGLTEATAFKTVSKAIAKANDAGLGEGDTVNLMVCEYPEVSWGTGRDYSFNLVLESNNPDLRSWVSMSDGFKFGGNTSFKNMKITPITTVYYNNHSISVDEKCTFMATNVYLGSSASSTSTKPINVTLGHFVSSKNIRLTDKNASKTYKEDVTFIVDNDLSTPTVQLASESGTTTFEKNLNISIANSKTIAFAKSGGDTDVKGALQVVVNSNIEILKEDKAALGGVNTTGGFYYITNATRVDDILNFTETAGTYTISDERYSVKAKDADDNEYISEDGVLVLPKPGEYVLTVKKEIENPVYYVSSKDGSDDNDGLSAETPKQAMNEVIRAAVEAGYWEGDTVTVNVIDNIDWTNEYELKSNSTEFDYTKPIVENYGYLLYIQSDNPAKLSTISLVFRQPMTGDTEFQNIKLNHGVSSEGKANIWATNKNLTYGDNVIITNTDYKYNFVFGTFNGSGKFDGQNVVIKNALRGNIALGNDGHQGSSSRIFSEDVSLVLDNPKINSNLVTGCYFGGTGIIKKNYNIDIKEAESVQFRPGSRETAGLVSRIEVQGALQVIVNDDIILDSQSKATLDDCAVSGNLYILNNASGIKDLLNFTETAGKYEVALGSERCEVIAIDKDGNIYKSADGYLVLPESGEYLIDAKVTSAEGEYYVSADGVDTNDGKTTNTPVATVERAVKLAQAAGYVSGDTVVIKFIGSNYTLTNIPAYAFNLKYTSATTTKTKITVAGGTVIAYKNSGATVFDNVELYVNGTWSAVYFKGANIHFTENCKYGGKGNNSIGLLAGNTSISLSESGAQKIVLDSKIPYLISLSNTSYAKVERLGDIELVLNNASNSTKISFNASYGGSVNGTTVYQNLNFNIKALGGITFGSADGVTVNGAVQIIDSQGLGITTETAGLCDIDADKYIINNNTGNKDIITFTQTAGQFAVDSTKYIVVATDGNNNKVTSENGLLVLPNADIYTLTLQHSHYYANDCDVSCNSCGYNRDNAHVYDNDCDKYCNSCTNMRAITHTYDGDCDKLCNVCYEYRATEHSFTNAVDLDCDICGAVRTINVTMLFTGEDGVTYYYNNGKKSDATGIVELDGKKIYINKGRFFGATGLVTVDGKKMYINKGYFKGASGLVTISGKKMYINKGYFLGKSGLVTLKGKTVYINKGYFTGASGLVTISGKKRYINKGYFTGASGLVTISGKKMYINKGYFTGASGLVTISGKKMYINKGYFTGASGLVTISGKKAYINKGYFNTTTAIVKISGKKYYIKKGYAQLSFSGKVKISGKTYTVKKGIVK